MSKAEIRPSTSSNHVWDASNWAPIVRQRLRAGEPRRQARELAFRRYQARVRQLPAWSDESRPTPEEHAAMFPPIADGIAIANPEGMLDISYGIVEREKPYAFTIELTCAGAHVGELQLNRSDATKMAMTIIGIAMCFGYRLTKEERAALVHILETGAADNQIAAR
jgi:hypothetical protein